VNTVRQDDCVSELTSTQHITRERRRRRGCQSFSAKSESVIGM